MLGGERRRARARLPGARARRAFAGKEVLELPLHRDRGFLPDLDAVAGRHWRDVALPVAQLPEQPDGRDRAARALRAGRRARPRARLRAGLRRGLLRALLRREPPASALELRGPTNVVVFNTLSKRSSMPGYRSGFVAGDPELIARSSATGPTSARAAGVRPARGGRRLERRGARRGGARDLRAKRDVLLPVLEAHGLRHAGGDATFFLWLDAGPARRRAAARLLERGIVLAPGSFFGPAGAGYLRLALVPTLAECERAAERLDALLA